MGKKVLILYISKFSGHYHAARAIEDAFLRFAPDSEVEKINALDYTNPILGRIINRAYLQVIKKRPNIWGDMYDNPAVLKKTQKARETLHRFNMSKIKRLIERKKPDVVICTQAFPCGMVADYKKKMEREDLKLVGVLTDRAAHSYWLYDEVDFYVVPDDQTAATMEKKGIPRERVRVLGIPVDPRFKRPHDQDHVRRDLGLSGKHPTVLIMGGSQGLGAIEEVVKSLSSDKEHNYQLVVVTGKNKRLFSRLSRFRKKTPGAKICILPYVANIDALMEISDIIVTKAGGITTSEALVKKLPMIIVDPIPGHERMNTDYLVKKGAALEISDYGQIHGMINRVFDSKDMLSGMKKSAASLAKPDSASDIMRLALSEK